MYTHRFDAIPAPSIGSLYRSEAKCHCSVETTLASKQVEVPLSLFARSPHGSVGYRELAKAVWIPPTIRTVTTAAMMAKDIAS